MFFPGVCYILCGSRFAVSLYDVWNMNLQKFFMIICRKFILSYDFLVDNQ